MSKNLITNSTVRAALLASGNVQPAQGRPAVNNKRDWKESNAAAIAARRKELGIKPVVAKRLAELRMVPTASAVKAVEELQS